MYSWFKCSLAWAASWNCCAILLLLFLSRITFANEFNILFISIKYVEVHFNLVVSVLLFTIINPMIHTWIEITLFCFCYKNRNVLILKAYDAHSCVCKTSKCVSQNQYTHMWLQMFVRIWNNHCLLAKSSDDAVGIYIKENLFLFAALHWNNHIRCLTFHQFLAENRRPTKHFLRILLWRVVHF